jgi:uncharacterized protein (TIGR03382 family)
MLGAMRMAIVVAACAACSAEAASSELDRSVVYGTDDRQDVYAFPDATWAAEAVGFSAVVVDRTTLNVSNPNDIGLPTTTLQAAFDVCPDERFATQLAAGICSATLIAPDLVLTSGQCIDAAACSTTAFVFDYTMTSVTSRATITSADVYPCSAVVVRERTATADYAIVRLDRDVTGRTPARVSTGTTVPAGRKLLAAGYPSGLPLKLAANGSVRDARTATTDYFIAGMDTFGNAGSGIFDAISKQLVGVHVRGASDYVADGSCNRVNPCPATGCRGEDATYAFRAIAALCATAPEPELCSCGDTTCNPALGETTATCPADCGVACGDGACNGSETPTSCATDCTACGNAACDAGETQTTCCFDCGCPVGSTCYSNTCGPTNVGDDCTDAVVLTPTGTQTATDTTATASEDFVGSCGGEGSPDRVYTFTLAAPTNIVASTTGFDAVLYLRGTCSDDTTELACDDDSAGGGNPRITMALPAGDYALIVDGFSGTQGDYTLTVTFTCTDTDGDGTCDDADGCPTDPDKTAPGVCGCGVVESTTDTDGDGTADCVDGCAADPGKTAPGTCGCGVADTDTDADGTPDCTDGCADDPAKSDPGTCGCGVPESTGDGDGDGAAGCADACPWNAGKQEPGVCGCGAEDIDRDGDGEVDCPLPPLPSQTAAGCQASAGGSFALVWLVLGLLVLERSRRATS